MSNRTRISLFVIVNLLVPAAFFIALQTLDIYFYSLSDELDYNAVIVFGILSAMGITILSLALSKAIPKRSVDIRIIKPSRPSNTESLCHIILIRHGETNTHIKDKKYGWDDLALSEEGRSQITAVSEKLSQTSVKAIYTDSLPYSIETAKILAKPHEETFIATDPALKFSYKRHTSWGFFLSKEQKKKKLFQEIVKDTTAYFQRMASIHPGETIFVVTHDYAIRYLLHSLGESCTALENDGAVCIASDGKSLWGTEIKKEKSPEKLLKNKDTHQEYKLIQALAQHKKNTTSAAK